MQGKRLPMRPPTSALVACKTARPVRSRLGPTRTPCRRMSLDMPPPRHTQAAPRRSHARAMHPRSPTRTAMPQHSHMSPTHPHSRPQEPHSMHLPSHMCPPGLRLVPCSRNARKVTSPRGSRAICCSLGSSIPIPTCSHPEALKWWRACGRPTSDVPPSSAGIAGATSTARIASGLHARCSPTWTADGACTLTCPLFGRRCLPTIRSTCCETSWCLQCGAPRRKTARRT